jgi:hypothetical protein
MSDDLPVPRRVCPLCDRVRVTAPDFCLECRYWAQPRGDVTGACYLEQAVVNRSGTAPACRHGVRK